MTTRIRYRRRTGENMTSRDYNIWVQARRYGRWRFAGWVSGFGPGPGGWAALAVGATAWTHYRPTRREAVRDMLAGRTYLNS